MVDEKNIIDDDEEEVIFDDDEYYHEIDIKPILENVLKLDIQKDANVYDFISFDEMDAFISYKGYEVDFSKMSEKRGFFISYVWMNYVENILMLKDSSIKRHTYAWLILRQILMTQIMKRQSIF